MQVQTLNSPKQISARRQRQLTAEQLDTRTRLAITLASDQPDYEKNRAIALAAAHNSDKVAGFIFWCNNFAWLQDPEAKDITYKDIPFLLYDYQEYAARQIITAIESGTDLPIEKSRKMGLSWLCMCIFVYLWQFHRYDFLVGSQTRDKVDKKGDPNCLFEKARYIIRTQPTWMRPALKALEHDKNLLLIHPQNRATISGESNNVNFGRAGRSRAILFDEFTSWEQTDKAAWQSCGSTTKCRIALSTPNTRGINCHYYTVVQNAKKKNLPIIRLHWTLNPLFADKLYYDDLSLPRSPWYDNQCKRATSLAEVSQELDIDYEASMAGKVFSDFNIEHNVVSHEDIQYDADLPLYVAWDFGLDTTAMLFLQEDKKNRTINLFDEYENNGRAEGTDIYHYLDVLDARGYKSGVHYGDPHSGENNSLTSGTSNANILRRNGIIFKCQRARIKQRVGAARNIINRLRVSDKCILAIEMFASWQLKETTGLPDHSPFSHIGESFTYFAYNHSLNKPIKAVSKKNYATTSGGVVG